MTSLDQIKPGPKLATLEVPIGDSVIDYDFVLAYPPTFRFSEQFFAAAKRDFDPPAVAIGIEKPDKGLPHIALDASDRSKRIPGLLRRASEQSLEASKVELVIVDPEKNQVETEFLLDSGYFRRGGELAFKAAVRVES